MFLKQTNTAIAKTFMTLGIMSAILYNVWPLGYLLNGKVARHDLVSELQAANQPYRTLFVSFDVITGIMVLILAYYIARIVRDHSRARTAILFGLVLFSICTIIGAIIPLPNNAAAPDPKEVVLSLHGTVSILAAIGTVLSTAGAIRYCRHHKLNDIFVDSITAVLTVSGIVFLACYASNKGALYAEQVYLLATGASLITISHVLAKHWRLK